jgi:hypothetical protein
MKIVTQALDQFEKNYMYLNLIVHALFFAVFLGIVYINTIYLRQLNIFIQVVVCLFLMIRFHPFRKHEFHGYDAGIIFSCALFLLLNLGMVEWVKQYLPSLENEIKL